MLPKRNGKKRFFLKGFQHLKRARGLRDQPGFLQAPVTVHKILPHALTIANLCMGMAALRCGLNGQWGQALAFLMLAILFDGLDGRVARYLGMCSSFGAELDSLSDFLSFGIAPALLLYLFALQDAGGLGWACCLFFVTCIALRLARFHVMQRDPVIVHKFFTGVPAPAACFLLVFPLVCALDTSQIICMPLWSVQIWTLGCGILAISSLPTPSLKTVKLSARLVLPALMGVGMLIALSINTPWKTWMGMSILYAIALPILFFLEKRRKAKSM